MVRIIQSTSDDPVYNLAYEAYLTETVTTDQPVLFLWQNKHTIVVGRHQNPWKECLVNKFIGDGGQVIRRLSGGGTVYHDEGNLNFSIIDHQSTYCVEKNIAMLKKAMASLGFEVTYSGKNDLTISGKKFSGHAFFKRGEGCCHHGAILVDTNLTTLSHYLTPSKLKIQTKSIDSVRARVTNLSDLDTGVTVGKVSHAIGYHFSSTEASNLVVVDRDKIKSDAPVWVEHFSGWDWTYAESPPFDISLEARYNWGTIEVGMTVSNKVINAITIHTDSNDSDLFTAVIHSLEGCAFNKDAIDSAIDNACNENTIAVDLKELMNSLV